MPLHEHLAKKIERIYCEDALKFIYSKQESKLLASLQGLQSILNLPMKDTLKIVRLLEELNLIEVKADGMYLLKKGHHIALQIVRAHRLWETYLSWETGTSILNVHKHAERKEHELSRDDLDALDAHLGYPSLDPHGDPIPDRAGRFRDQRHAGLNDLNIGERGIITHIEDEPEEIFRKLVKIGFRVNAALEVVDKKAYIVTVAYRDQLIELDNLEINQIQIRRIEEIPEKKFSLSELAPGETSRVVSISSRLQGLPRRRLLDLGITPGARITSFLPSSFGGDPTMYIVRGTKIALRQNQTKYIYVTPPAFV